MRLNRNAELQLQLTINTGDNKDSSSTSLSRADGGGGGGGGCGGCGMMMHPSITFHIFASIPYSDSYSHTAAVLRCTVHYAQYMLMEGVYTHTHTEAEAEAARMNEWMNEMKWIVEMVMVVPSKRKSPLGKSRFRTSSGFHWIEKPIPSAVLFSFAVCSWVTRPDDNEHGNRFVSK